MLEVILFFVYFFLLEGVKTLLSNPQSHADQRMALLKAINRRCSPFMFKANFS